MSKKVDLNKFKDVVSHLKTKQAQLKHLVSKETISEAKKYAHSSKMELQKLIKNTDVKKVRNMIEKEAKELQKLQKNLPQEFAKFTKFMDGQKKEFEKLLKSVTAGKKSKASSGSGGAKKTSSRKPKTATVAPQAEVHGEANSEQASEPQQ